MIQESELLPVLLSIVRDFQPMDREPPLRFQVSVVSPRLVFLWDASTEAEEAIAAAVAGQFGSVLATAVSPLVGLLLQADDAEQVARILRPAYASAIGPAQPENPF